MARKRVHNRKGLESNRKRLRNAMKPAEIRLWKYLKGGQLDGRKFRRQHSCGQYILDFYCPAEKLAIELDGESHASAMAAAKDAERDAYLAEQGIRVLRFENRVVWDMIDGLLQRIRESFS